MCVVFLIYGSYSFYRISPSVLSEKYPLGYIIFDVDRTNSVFPLSSEQLIDKWDFDWSVVKIYDIDANDIVIGFPTIRPKGAGIPIVAGIGIRSPKKIGPIPPNPRAGLFSDGIIQLKAEILAINSKGIVLLMGFRPARK
jgi:hypothetical protein